MDAEPVEADARSNWMTRPPGRTAVAVDANGAVLGTSNMYANRPNQGSHIASGSLMVGPLARGHGVGRALLQDMIQWATGTDFVAIQFNAVVETNTAAVRLYLSEGFRIIGSAPGAFRHPDHGPVNLLIMWRDLD